MDVSPMQPSSVPPSYLLSQASATPRPSFIPAPKKGINVVNVSPPGEQPKSWQTQNKSLLLLAQKAAAARAAAAANAPKAGLSASEALAARVAAVKQAVAAKQGLPITGAGQIVPAKVVKSETITLYLDEVFMPSRPQVPPTPYDREVFVDPFPAEEGSQELQDWLISFGEVEEVFRIAGEDRGYLLFKEPEAAAKCVTAFAGTWSESERAVTGQKTSRRNQCAYPESLISHFLGQDGANMKDISSRVGISSFDLKVGSTARGDKGEATRVRFVASGSSEQLTLLRREVEEQLEKVHREMTRLIDEAAPCKVAVRGFSANASIDEVKNLFSGHEVSNADLTRSGFATVEFPSSSEARRAALENDGRNLDVMASNAQVLRCTLDCPWGGSAPANEDAIKDDREDGRSGQKRPWDNGSRRDSGKQQDWHETNRREEPKEKAPASLPSTEEIEDFITANGVDDHAASVFRECEPEVQARVIERGFVADKKNPSAALLTRIRESRQDVDKGRGKHDRDRGRDKGRGKQRHEREDRGRGSDDRRGDREDRGRERDMHEEARRHDEWERLYDQTNDAFYYFNHISGESSWYPPEERPPLGFARPLEGSVPRPTSIFDERDRRDMDRRPPARGPPPIGWQVEEFLRNNAVDHGAADDLRDCPPEVQFRVVSKGDLIGARNPSGALIARIRDARNELRQVRDRSSRSRSPRRRRRR